MEFLRSMLQRVANTVALSSLEKEHLPPCPRTSETMASRESVYWTSLQQSPGGKAGVAWENPRDVSARICASRA